MTVDESGLGALLDLGPFAELGISTRSTLKQHLKPDKLFREQTLFRENGRGDRCYIVASGILRVSIEDYEGEETWPALVGAGDVVGEMSLIDKGRRSATVTAMTDCDLWQLSRSSFDEITRQDMELYRCISRLICNRLRMTNQLICDERLGLEGRIAAVMRRLASAFGERRGDGSVLIRYHIGQSRIAELASASREHVNRQFRNWRTAGICDRVDNYYCLFDDDYWDNRSGQPLPLISG